MAPSENSFQSCQQIRAKGLPLSERVFIPEPFDIRLGTLSMHGANPSTLLATVPQFLLTRIWRSCAAGFDASGGRRAGSAR